MQLGSFEGIPEKIQLIVDKKAFKTPQEEIRVMENLITHAETINHREYLGKLVAEIKMYLKTIEKGNVR